MAAANNEFFEALSMLEHERGITAEYLIEKIKAAIIIAVKKNYESGGFTSVWTSTPTPAALMWR